MDIKTYIFGNPDGWKLYNEDQTEVAYFKSFYLNTRRGERLMVNRRDDGSIVYVYLMYGVSEIPTDANGDRKRGGYGHFGMAMILNGGQYTPEFGTVFRFMSTLFNRMLEREDSPIVRNATPLYAANGETMPYSYRINKFDQAGEAMDWLQSMMPRIFDKTGLTAISADNRFEDAVIGRIATLSDNATDGDMLSAFHKNRWIAISPEFKQISDGNSSEPKVEIEFEELKSLNQNISKKLLLWSTGTQKPDSEEKKNFKKRISESRVLLANYERENPTSENIDIVRAQQSDFSLYAEQYEKIIEQIQERKDVVIGSQPVRPVAETPVVTISGANNANNNATGNKVRLDNGRSQKISHDNRHDNNRKDESGFISPKLLGIVAMIVIFVVVSIALVNSNSDNAVNNPIESIGENVDVEPEEFNPEEFYRLVGQERFADAYNLIKGDRNNSDYISSLKKATEDYLWGLVDREDVVGLGDFFTSMRNEDMLGKLGYDEFDNNSTEWNEKLKVLVGLRSLAQKSSTTAEDVIAAEQSNVQLGDRYKKLVDIIKSKQIQEETRTSGIIREGVSSGQATAPVNITVTIIKAVSPNNSEGGTTESKTITKDTGVGFDINGSVKITADGNKIIMSEKYNAIKKDNGYCWILQPRAEDMGKTLIFYVEYDNERYPIAFNVK